MDNKNLLIWLAIGWGVVTTRLFATAYSLPDWRGFIVTEIQLVVAVLVLWKLLKVSDGEREKFKKD